METYQQTNLPIASHDLPGLQSLPMEPISPRYGQMNLLVFGTLTPLISILIAVVLLQPWLAVPEKLKIVLSIGLAVVSVLGIAIFIYHFFADRLIFYTVREQDIVLYKGLFFQKVICQPILRVQHIDIQRGPLERLFSLSTVKVYSAGGSDYTLAIPGLPVEIAERIRQFVLDHADLTRD